MPRGRKKKAVSEVTSPLVTEASGCNYRGIRFADPDITSVKETEVLALLSPELPQFDPAFERLFEAPDGMILVGAKDRETILYRQGNGGKGQMIQPKR